MEAPKIFSRSKRRFLHFKVNFPGNTLCYANQRTIFTVKGDFAIYLDYVVLGQLIPAKNNLENIHEYKCKQNEVKLYVSFYDTNNVKFWGLDTHSSWSEVRPFSCMTTMKVNQTCAFSFWKTCAKYLSGDTL